MPPAFLRGLISATPLVSVLVVGRALLLSLVVLTVASGSIAIVIDRVGESVTVGEQSVCVP